MRRSLRVFWNLFRCVSANRSVSFTLSRWCSADDSDDVVRDSSLHETSQSKWLPQNSHIVSASVDESEDGGMDGDNDENYELLSELNSKQLFNLVKPTLREGRTLSHYAHTTQHLQVVTSS